MAAAPCKECGRRPKAPGRHRCVTCQLRHEPIGDQVAAAARRLAMVPPELRRKKSITMDRLAPQMTSWCAGCQSFRDFADFRNTPKTTHTQCFACRSAKSHGAMIEKTYGLSADDYGTLLEAQGGRCAICRARPKSKRLAVDHDHKSGAVRGLLCSRCNHDLMGSAWDSMAMARQRGALRIHSIPIEPQPAPTSHSSCPGQGASAASVTARTSRLVSCPSW